MSAELLLLRHGRTAWNAARRFQGQLDPPLDEVGIAQSEAVAPVVAALGPVALLTSDLQRAVATAAPLAAATGLTARVDPRLREIALGAWQGMTSDEAAVAFPAEHVAWVDGRDVRRGAVRPMWRWRCGRLPQSMMPCTPSATGWWWRSRTGVRRAPRPGPCWPCRGSAGQSLGPSATPGWACSDRPSAVVGGSSSGTVAALSCGYSRAVPWDGEGLWRSW